MSHMQSQCSVYMAHRNMNITSQTEARLIPHPLTRLAEFLSEWQVTFHHRQVSFYCQGSFYAFANFQNFATR